MEFNLDTGDACVDPSRVLIVERNPQNLTVIEDALSLVMPEAHSFCFSETVEVLDFLEKPAATIAMALIDLQLLGMDGTKLIRAICKKHPKVRILVLSSLVNQSLVLSVLRAGAQGFLDKKDFDQQILVSLEYLLKGGCPISPVAAGCLVGLIQQRGAVTKQMPMESDFRQLAEADSVPPLSPREIELLRLLSLGYGYSDAACHMEVALSTVQTHVRNCYRKLGVNSRTMAINVASSYGLI